MGPLICAAISQATGTMRWAIVYLVVMCLITLPMLKYLVNIKKGQEEAINFVDAGVELTIVTVNTASPNDDVDHEEKQGSN